MRKYLAAAALIVCVVFPADSAFPYEYMGKLSLAVSEQYNDNIFLTKSNKESDFVTFITPGIDLGIRSGGSSMAVSYSPSFSFYSSHDENNSTSHRLNADGVLGITERTTLTVNETYIRSKELTDIVSIPDFGPISRLAEREYNLVTATLSHKLRSNLILSAGGSYSLIDNKDTALNNARTYSGNVVLTYERSERTTLALTAIYTAYDFSGSSDATGQEYNLGIKYKLTPTLTMNLTGGATITKIKDGGPTDTGFSGGLELTKVFEKGTASVYFKQSVIPDSDNGQPVTDQTAGIVLSRPLSERWTASVSASYSRFKSTASGGGVDRDTIYANANMGYKIAPWADVSLTYSYVKSNDKGVSPQSYANNIISVALRVSYEKRSEAWTLSK